MFNTGITAPRFFYFLVAAAFLIGGAMNVVSGPGALTFVLFLIGFALGTWVIIDAIWQRHNEEIDSRAELTGKRSEFVRSIAAADSEVRSFLSLEWPELGVNDIDIEPAVYILHKGMNTNILLPCFQRFLQDSDEREFADVRRYNDDKSLQDAMSMSREAVRVQWDLATRHLVKKGFLSPNSAQGSHSFLWVTKDHYYRMVQWYLNGPQSLPSLPVLE